MTDAIRKKLLFFEEFWKGQGPYPIIFARPHFAREKQYLRYNLVEQHGDAGKLLEESLAALKPHLDLIDDGIPVVRSDLGTTLLPSGLGLEIQIQSDQQPWLKNHYTPQQYLEPAGPFTALKLVKNEVELSLQFYRLFYERRRRGELPPEVLPYVPETEGVFDLSYLIIGADLLLLLKDDPQCVHRIQRRSLELFLCGTRMFKDFLGEAAGSMIHGHGMPLGLWFPDTGARISEDACTLISEPMLEEFCLPYIREAARPFGRGFLHFCGKHEGFLRRVCELPEISTINLGNPESYDLNELFALLGRTRKTYLGHFGAEEKASGESYLERLAELCRRNGAKLILVSGYHPKGVEEKERLVRLWHSLTQPRRFF